MKEGFDIFDATPRYLGTPAAYTVVGRSSIPSPIHIETLDAHPSYVQRLHWPLQGETFQSCI